MLLALESAGIAGQRAVAADHPVTGHENRHRITADRRTHRPHSRRRSDLSCKLTISAGAAASDGLQRGPDPLLKGRAVQCKRHIELDRLALEIALEHRRHPLCDRIVIMSRA